MSSILKVDTIQDQSGNNIINESGNVITIGASGDTITVPAGATVSGFTSAGIDDNATSVAITINSSEQVGIGTASPSQPLHVYSTGNDIARIETNQTEGRLSLKDATGDAILKFRNDYRFTNSSGELARLNSSGNFGIGTSAPSEKLSVSGNIDTSGSILTSTNNSLKIISGGNATNAGSNLTLYGGTNADAGLFRFRNGTTVTTNVTAAGQIQGVSLAPSTPTFSFTSDTNTGMTRPTGDTLTLVTGGSERIRIDSSGNTMFAKSTQGDVNVVGAEIRNNGLGTFTRDGDTVLIANRKSSDGTLLEFRKDNTGFGTIGVNTGNNPFFSGSVANHGGIAFSDAGSSQPTMLPMSGGTTLADNSQNIGHPSYRWKNAYIGGSIFIGGTGSGNELSDYEEGNHASAFTTTGGSVTIGRNDLAYTKVGRKVTITGEIGISSVSSPVNPRLSLPFVIANHTVDRNMNFGAFLLNYAVNFNSDNQAVVAYGASGNSFVSFLYQTDNGAFGTYTPKANDSFFISFTYFTN